MNIKDVFNVALVEAKDWHPLHDTLNWMEEKGHVFEDESKAMYEKYKDKFDLFLHNLNTEKDDTKAAFALLYHSMKDGQPLTSEQKAQIGNQMKDLLKTVGLVGFAALPGGSLFFLLVGILKWNKYVMPSAFLKPAESKMKDEVVNRVLMIGVDEKAAIKKLMDYAEAHPYQVDDLLDIINGHKKPPGDDPRFVCKIPMGYRVVYTIENQPVGKCRHISISVGTKGSYPNPAAVTMLLQEFGFKETDLTKTRVKLEEAVEAVNIVEVIK